MSKWFIMSIDDFASKEEMFNLVVELTEKIKSQEATIRTKDDVILKQVRCIEELKARIDKIYEQILLSQQRRFGSSSEQTSLDQLPLFAMDTEETPELDKQTSKTVSYERKPKSTFHDKYGDLKTSEVHEHPLEGDALNCPCCGGAMKQVDTCVKHLIRVVPEVAEIVKHCFPRYRCPYCQEKNHNAPIVQAEDNVSVYPNCIALPDTIAHIITQKAVLSLPLYRQEKHWNRLGVKLSRQTMSNWVINCSERYFEPVYKILAELLVQLDILHADETPYPVLHDGDSKSNRGYMWLFSSCARELSAIAIYVYSKSRGFKTPEQFLKDFAGYVHADGYQVYKKLPNVMVSECWAHLRRKIFESHLLLGKDFAPDCPTKKALDYCDNVFRIDSQFKNLDPHERKRRRETELRPLVDEFFEWLESLTSLPNNTFRGAVRHALQQREYLMRFFEDGRLELSNNRAERQIKPLVIGRKNFMFSNTARGARATAVIYSLTETALANGLDPYKYFTWVLQQAPVLSKTDKDWAERLVPHNAPEWCRTQ